MQLSATRVSTLIDTGQSFAFDLPSNELQLSGLRVSTLVQAPSDLGGYEPISDTVQLSGLRVSTLVQAPSDLGGYEPVFDVVQFSGARISTSILVTNNFIQGTEEEGGNEGLEVSYLSSPIIG